MTKLTTQTKNPNRVNLYVDGQFYRGLDRIVAIKLGLKQGITLTPYLIDKLEATQTRNSAWEYSLRSLQRSPKSVAMMKRKLIEKFEPDVANTTIARLIESGILDDKKLAATLVEQYLEQGSKSKQQIFAKLLAKRIPSEVTQEVIGDADQNYERAAALKMARAKGSQLGELDWHEKFEKIGAYLARRGFRYDLIKEVVTPENLQTQKSA